MNGHEMDQVAETDEHESQSVNAPTGRSKDTVSNSTTCERLSPIHVPKLDNEGVIVRDETAEVITPVENAPRSSQTLQGMGVPLDVTQEPHTRSDIDDQGLCQ